MAKFIKVEELFSSGLCRSCVAQEVPGVCGVDNVPVSWSAVCKFMDRERIEFIERLIEMSKPIRKPVRRFEGLFGEACEGKVGWYNAEHPLCCGNCTA